jgi:2'-5' RNA ligase
MPKTLKTKSCFNIVMKFRAFISTDVGAKPEFIDLENTLEQTSADLKLVDPENIHITLKFLGDTEEELVEQITGSMQRAVAGIQPFTLKFKGIGAFPNPNYMKVIWVGMDNTDNLKTIANKLDTDLKSLGFRPEKRGFSAHLTVARVKSRRGKDELQKILKNYKNHEFGEIKIESIRLKKSDLTPKGPIYTTIKEIKLE